VYSDDPIFIEAEVVRGYLESNNAAVDSIEVRYSKKVDDQNKPKLPPFAKYLKNRSFVFRGDDNPQWEISFWQPIAEIGGMLVLQGGSSTLIAGLIAMGYNKPVLPCSGFGGIAMKLSSLLAEKGAITPDETVRLELEPAGAAAQDWANECVGILLSQAERIELKRQQQEGL
jgi:hypothetical protein